MLLHTITFVNNDSVNNDAFHSPSAQANSRIHLNLIYECDNNKRNSIIALNPPQQHNRPSKSTPQLPLQQSATREDNAIPASKTRAINSSNPPPSESNPPLRSRKKPADPYPPLPASIACESLRKMSAKRGKFRAALDRPSCRAGQKGRLRTRIDFNRNRHVNERAPIIGNAYVYTRECAANNNTPISRGSRTTGRYIRTRARTGGCARSRSPAMSSFELVHR